MKAKTDLYCPECENKVYEKGEELMSLFFTRSEECCDQCDTVLKRRSPGGQSDTWNFITLEKLNARKEARKTTYCEKVHKEVPPCPKNCGSRNIIQCLAYTYDSRRERGIK